MTEWWEWRNAPPADFAVIGDPVSHSLSPRMHAAALAKLGRTERYVALRVPSGEVELAFSELKSRGYKGLNVTVPLKEEAAALVILDEFARRCGSANTIALVEGKGTNTDGPGFVETLSGLVAPGDLVLLLGAGGSARSIALALYLAGYPLRVHNRTRARAEKMILDLEIEAEVVDDPAPEDARLIVNATSASLHKNGLNVPWDHARSDALAYDLVYGDTAFLSQARGAGLKTIDGGAMLVAQGARSLEYWLGVDAPRDVMTEALR